MEGNISIKLANYSQIDELILLNKDWHLDNLGNDINNGYLLDLYTVDKFKCIIEKNEVVVGILNEKIISYYLINTINEKDLSHRHALLIDEFKNRLIVPNHYKVGFGAQALVSKDFQGSNLRKEMLIELVKLLQEYDCLFSTISKSNIRAFKGHAKDGWEVIDQDDEKYYVLLNINNFKSAHSGFKILE